MYNIFCLQRGIVMKINISSIANSEGKVPVNGSVKMGRVIFDGGEYEFSDVDVTGNIVNIGGSLELKARAAGEYTTPCARCLKPVTISFDADIYEELGNDEDDGGALSSDRSECELSGIIEKSVISSLPITVLCSENCRGICPGCGAELNTEECTCEKDDWNPSFDILKNFKADL